VRARYVMSPVALALPRLRRSLPLPLGEGRGPLGATEWEG
jgi:hypothetical protein